MNLFEGELRSEGDKLELHTKFGTFVLPESMRQQLATKIGGGGLTVDCGIRAEDIAIRLESDGQPQTARGTVDLVEPMGSDIHVSLALNGEMLLVRAVPDLPVQEMQTVTAAPNLAKIHLFDKTDGRNLLAPA
jgi:ABC-type sugar transport system ATPase subunit